MTLYRERSCRNTSIGYRSRQYEKDPLADEQLAPVIKALEEGKPLPAGSSPGLHRTFIQNRVLCRKFKTSSCTSIAKTQLVIPSDMKAAVLQQLHDNAGHLGLRKRTESMKERFYWAGYELDIEKWVRECQQCQQRNAPQPKPQAPLGSIKATHPFEKYLGILWDLYPPLQKERGTS